jgi:Putative prokaryotic signal transducing protein
VSLVELRTFHDAFEAEIVCGRLRAEGVEALVFDGGLTAAYGGALPVRLMVLAEDVERARALIAKDAQPEPVDRGPWSDLAD